MAKNAEQAGKYNVAFEAFYCLAMPDACIDVLLKAKMVAQACIFAKAHAPSRLNSLIKDWSEHLKEQGLQFLPENVCESQKETLEADLIIEQQLREKIYEQPKADAKDFNQVKQS